MPNQLEMRSQGSNFEIREAEGDQKFIEGYAVEWEKMSLPIGYYYKFQERFKKGAFDEYLSSSDDSKFLVDHERGKVLGRSKKGTLTLRSDDRGLWYSLQIPKTTLGADAIEDVRSGNKEHISVGFIKILDEWEESEGKNPIRTVIKASLPEISLTAWPAYEDTSASARNKDAQDDPYKEYLEQRKSSESYKNSLNIKRKKLDLLEKL